jgi:hypothetical protein
MNWGEVGTRSALTFIQAFLAVIMVQGVDSVTSFDDAKPALIAAVAALISMIYRVVREYSAAKGYDTDE